MAKNDPANPYLHPCWLCGRRRADHTFSSHCYIARHHGAQFESVILVETAHG